jgi:predicted dehydrogenase
MSRRTTRRQFLQGTAAVGAGFFVSGAPLLVAAEKSDKLRFAGIGVGGKGDGDINQAGSFGEIVALCDIDADRLDKQGANHPRAKKFFDFREMFDKMGKDIDAVTISGPDHMHALAAAMAIKMKKHVYVQKPLTHTVFEARRLRELAKEHGVCSQMGNQGTAANGLRYAVEQVQAGRIGKVSEAHVWTNRPIWPQAPGVTMRLPEQPIPAHVKWDLFLAGAPERPYNKGYHPFNWRGWWDFGTGALGDMACHTANMAFMALKLASPTSIVAEATDVNPETYPSSAHITFQFPARGDMPPVKFVWYEGKKGGKNVLPDAQLVKGQGERPQGPSIFFKDNVWQFRGDDKKTKTISSGSFLIGEKGTLFSPDDYGADSYIVTPDGVERLKGDPEKLPRNGKGDNGQKEEWVQAIKANKPSLALSNFDYAAMLTETILLGNVAIKAGKKLEFDGAKLVFTNAPECNALLTTEYRKGWGL